MSRAHRVTIHQQGFIRIAARDQMSVGNLLHCRPSFHSHATKWRVSGLVETFVSTCADKTVSERDCEW